MTPDDFVKILLPYALSAETQYKVPALVALAQSALETGWGRSAPGNMYFGMKTGKSYSGKKQLITTKEVHTTKDVKYPEIISIVQRPDGKYLYTVKDWFRAYDSPKQSFEDYARLLSTNPRYKEAFKYSDPILFAQEIKKAGYATDPDYLTKIKSLIEQIKKKASL